MDTCIQHICAAPAANPARDMEREGVGVGKKSAALLTRPVRTRAQGTAAREGEGREWNATGSIHGRLGLRRVQARGRERRQQGTGAAEEKEAGRQGEGGGGRRTTGTVVHHTLPGEGQNSN
jgi:hypothetical protein